MTSEPRDLDAEIEASLEGVQNLQDLSATEEEAQRSKARRKDGSQTQTGTIVGITGRDVFVELGPRVQGVANLSEFDETPEIGQSFEFTMRGREDDLWVLSRRDAMALAAWNDLQVGSAVKARVTGQNTGGLELKIGPGSAFMPASHVALGRVEDLSSMLGQTLLCQVIEVDAKRKRVVVSRRAVLEAERAEARAGAADSLSLGGIVRGKVVRIEPFGAFVEIGPGLEGMVHVSNVSRKRVEKLEDVLQVGQEVEAMVLKVEDGGKRIGLGMKQLEPDPWDEVSHLFHEDQTVEGKVTRIADFGAFVEIGPGIDGLLHISQIQAERVRRVQDVLKVGEEVTVRIKEIDPAARRISLTRLAEGGATIGSEDAADAGAVREAISRSSNQSPLGTNLGDLFKKALGDKQK
ncbi:MAG: S1 RNA-binding domain-containing protein [Planctomycetes bacterium]|nr:S1 RNA-binding domain-containing protein [Planctomycetota bacterium]MCB9903779.1 S1 RNA-binding domain-containing protein [Planctomycetota bacterium]